MSSSGSVSFWTPLVDLWETYVVEPFSAPLSNPTCPYSGLKEGAPFGTLFLVPSYLLPLRSSKTSWLCDAGLASMAYFYFDFRDTVKQNRRSFKLLLSPLFSTFCSLRLFAATYSTVYTRLMTTAHPSPTDDVVLIQCPKQTLTFSSGQPLYIIA